MPRFTAKLVAGRKPPYDTWAFAIVPEDVRARLGGGARIPVTGTIAGESFRAPISKGDGRYRFAVTRAVRDAAGVIRRVYEVDPLVCPRCGGEFVESGVGGGLQNSSQITPGPVASSAGQWGAKGRAYQLPHLLHDLVDQEW